VVVSVEWAALQLPAEVTSVGAARAAVRSWAAEQGANPLGLEALTLITSELVANAVTATTEPVTVRFTLDGGLARLEVDDDAPGRPVLREGSQHGGYGLRLVSELAETWGCIAGVGHKTVWAEVAISR
jgi:anti-sigma regulatory factor (Ser/Thr protein kinase)